MNTPVGMFSREAGDAGRSAAPHSEKSIASGIAPGKQLHSIVAFVDMLRSLPLLCTWHRIRAFFMSRPRTRKSVARQSAAEKPAIKQPQNESVGGQSADQHFAEKDFTKPISLQLDAGALQSIHIGPAGWSYTDWAGYVYPSPRPKGFHEATYLAQFFDTIEINTSFYAPLRADHARQWLDRVAANPRFIFTAKLWQKFTHDPSSMPMARGLLSSSAAATPEASPANTGLPVATTQDEHDVRAGFDVLRAVGKLGAVLLQFPFSFHRDAETTTYLASLLQRFADYPLAVELRHASWYDAEILALLREHHAAFCNIDQPVIGRSLQPSAESTSAIGYVRLHGRRYDTWFDDDPSIPQHERYNYLYSTDELAPWTERIRNIAEKTRDVFVIANNHYLGKAVVNALQLISLLTRSKVRVPEPLRHRYPELEAIASEPSAAPTLFPLRK